MSSIITRRAFPEDLGAIGWAFATFDDDGVSATDRGATNPTANVSATSTAAPGKALINRERSLFFSLPFNITFLLLRIFAICSSGMARCRKTSRWLSLLRAPRGYLPRVYTVISIPTGPSYTATFVGCFGWEQEAVPAYS